MEILEKALHVIGYITMVGAVLLMTWVALVTSDIAPWLSSLAAIKCRLFHRKYHKWGRVYVPASFGIGGGTYHRGLYCAKCECWIIYETLEDQSHFPPGEAGAA